MCPVQRGVGVLCREVPLYSCILLADPSAKFVKTAQSDVDAITLMGPDQQLVGITRHGAIVLVNPGEQETSVGVYTPI